MSRFGRMWLRIAPIAGARGAREHRRRLVAGLSGTVVEVDLYPDAVTRVLA